MKKIILLCLLAGISFVACKKNSISASSDKEIYSFVLPMPSPIPWEAGVIGTDSIIVKVAPGVSLSDIAPYIEFTGVSISPAMGVPVNFTQPVTYTVTAEDGSTKNYVVVVSGKSTTKSIIDFRFKTAENPGLTSETVGQLLNDSSILVRVASSVDVHNLVPSITHNGISINPQSGQAADFSSPVNYTVTAEDGSTKKYNVLVTSNSTVFISSANGYVYALDAGTGVMKWSFNGGHQMGSPIYYQGKIYVAAQGGSVYCLNAETGASVWSFSNQTTNYTTPCLYNGKLYIGYNRTNPYGTGLYALDATTGSLSWTKPISGIGYGGIATPAAADGYVVLTEFNSGIQVLNADNGNYVWGQNPGIIMANPLVTGGVVYVGSETKLLSAYNLATGSVLWQTGGVPNPFSAPVMANDIIYVGGSLRMYAINKSDGSIIWSEESWGGYYGLGDNTHSSVGRFSSPAVSLADTALYAGSDDYVTYCLNLNTGAKKWFYSNSVEIKETSPNPVVAHGMVIVNREDKSLYAFSTKSASILWKFTATDAINTDPCMIDNSGNVFYTGNSGQQ